VDEQGKPATCDQQRKQRGGFGKNEDALRATPGIEKRDDRGDEKRQWCSEWDEVERQDKSPNRAFAVAISVPFH
jgi:hypothetical protein